MCRRNQRDRLGLVQADAMDFTGGSNRKIRRFEKPLECRRRSGFTVVGMIISASILSVAMTTTAVRPPARWIRNSPIMDAASVTAIDRCEILNCIVDPKAEENLAAGDVPPFGRIGQSKRFMIRSLLGFDPHQRFLCQLGRCPADRLA